MSGVRKEGSEKRVRSHFVPSTASRCRCRPPQFKWPPNHRPGGPPSPRLTHPGPDESARSIDSRERAGQRRPAAPTSQRPRLTRHVRLLRFDPHDRLAHVMRGLRTEKPDGSNYCTILPARASGGLHRCYWTRPVLLSRPVFLSRSLRSFPCVPGTPPDARTP